MWTAWVRITDAATKKPLVGATVQGLNTGQASQPADSEGIIEVQCEDPAPEQAFAEAPGYEASEIYIQDQLVNDRSNPQPFGLTKDQSSGGCGIGMLAMLATAATAAVLARRS